MIEEDQLGHQHPDTLTSANNLGVLLKQQGKFSEAHGKSRFSYEFPCEITICISRAHSYSTTTT